MFVPHQIKMFPSQRLEKYFPNLKQLNGEVAVCSLSPLSAFHFHCLTALFLLALECVGFETLRGGTLKVSLCVCQALGMGLLM